MQSESIFAELIQRVVALGGFQGLMKERESQYNLRKYKITEISTDNALPIYQHIVEKFYKNHNPGDSGTWVENQLRLFLWAVVCYLEVHRKPIATLSSGDWNFFSHIFYIKEYNLFEYQARTLLDEEVRLAKWSNEEDCMLYNIINRQRNAKWNQIAKSLFINSNKTYLRSSKQCRERWLNHLDPSKSKTGWSLQEFLSLFQHVVDKGKKWAVLVKKLNDRRSEHSIKNKFNSLIKKQSRLTPGLSETQLCQELILSINRIMETHKIEHCDEFIFGTSIKIRNQENLSRKQKYGHLKKFTQSPETMESLRKKFDVFRKKIEKFQLPNQTSLTKENKKQDNLPSNLLLSDKIHDNEEMNKHMTMQKEEDSIFCDDSYENQGVINRNQLLFTEDLKSLINENQLDV